MNEAAQPPRDVTVPEADAYEQGRDWDEAEKPDEVRLPPDVPEADAVEQSLPAPLDDEEH